MTNQKSLVKIVHRLKPLINVKGMSERNIRYSNKSRKGKWIYLINVDLSFSTPGDYEKLKILYDRILLDKPIRYTLGWKWWLTCRNFDGFVESE